MSPERREQEPTSSVKRPNKLPKKRPSMHLQNSSLSTSIEVSEWKKTRLLRATYGPIRFKKYIEQDGVGKVWWGHTFEEQDTVKLLVGELDIPTQDVYCGIYKASVS